MTHASRVLESHELSGEGINFDSHIYFIDHTRTWRASPYECSAQCWSHLRDNTNIKDVHIIYSNKADMRRMIMIAKWYSGNHVGLRLPGICLTGEENPRKTSLRKLAPTGDRTQTRCVTGAHATACSKVMNLINILNYSFFYFLFCIILINPVTF